MNDLSIDEAKSGNELLTLMGNVLATWQSVEHVVAEVYLIFFRPSRADPASVAFFAVRTFDMKLGVVNALVNFFCSEQQKEAWTSLLRRVRKCSGSRNAVAHGLVSSRTNRPSRVCNWREHLQHCRFPRRRWHAKWLLHPERIKRDVLYIFGFDERYGQLSSRTCQRCSAAICAQ